MGVSFFITDHEPHRGFSQSAKKIEGLSKGKSFGSSGPMGVVFTTLILSSFPTEKELDYS